jgi:hypothetical protein
VTGYACIDFETTGLFPTRHDRVLAVCATTKAVVISAVAHAERAAARSRAAPHEHSQHGEPGRCGLCQSRSRVGCSVVHLLLRRRRACGTASA